jgi:Glycosyl transferase family 2
VSLSEMDWRSSGGETSCLPRTIDAGVVAHNDEDRLERSVRSLLEQELPVGIQWGRIWLIASGCTDRTPEIALTFQSEDGRVRVVVEAARRGKAAAIQEVLHRAESESVVLLNSDAIARAGAVSALLAKGVGKSAPFAVMARPVVASTSAGDWTKTIASMWDLHHEYHLDLLATGQGTHLSDELLLLGGRPFPPMPSGVINDGSYLAVWLRQHGGGCWYAPDALVEIETPVSQADHLRQRRRIHVGNAQVARLLGLPPETLPRRFWKQPVTTAQAVVRIAGRPDGARHLARLAAGELVAHTLAWWDRLPPARDHIRWERIGTAHRERRTPRDPVESEDQGTRTTPATVEGRIGTLLGTCEQFATGLRLDEFVSLLPQDGPTTEEEVRSWFRSHPEVGKLEGDLVFSSRSPPEDMATRRERGRQYRGAARDLLERELAPTLPWLRCVVISGSTAYGEPEEGDDLDLFVVSRAGGLWFSLVWTYLALRWRKREGRSANKPRVCLNYVLDDRSAPGEFSRRQEFHVAREALTSSAVFGGQYYRSLLASASWMSSELPRLYSQRVGDAQPPAPEPAPFAVRMLNGVAYAALATYLQLVGLRRNRRLEREGRSEDIFRTITRWRQLAFDSRRFDSLRGRPLSQGTNLEPSARVRSGQRATSHRKAGFSQAAEPSAR